MTTKTDEQERADFEAEIRENWGFAKLERVGGDYIDPGTQGLWGLWSRRAALQSQDREDAERLDWLLRKLPSDAIRYCVGVLDDTADAEEFRAAIDHARRVEENK